MADLENPKPSAGSNVPPLSTSMSTSGRCHWCGYQLKGLPILGECPECGTYGKCPECGKAYTAKSAARLQPWPSAYVICLRLGWPIVGLVISGILTVSTDSYDLQGWVMGFGYFMAVAIAINSYFQVRSMLRRSLPEQIRTKGPVAIWRKIGTTICVIILLVFIGGPLGISVACLIMLSNY